LSNMLAGIKLLVEEMERRNNLDCQLEITGAVRRLPADSELALSPITREAFSRIKWKTWLPMVDWVWWG
jgi:signal transduction histidine kinase